MTSPATMFPPSQPDRPRRLTEEEYVAWAYKQEFETEWVDGEVIYMPPISGTHDTLQRWLSAMLEQYAQERDLGEVRGPQFQMRLARPSRREPDVLFVAKERLHLLKETYLAGPADLTIELVSPESQSRDWRVKYLEYETGGVREYWIIDPAAEQVEAYELKDGRYVRIDERDGKIASATVPGWFVRVAWLWPQGRPKLREALAELGVK